MTERARAADQHARDPASDLVRVAGIGVSPPVTEGQARRLAPLGLLADEPRSLLEAWGRVDAMWATTVDRALRLAPEQLDERVDGEWSFLETLRHLVFVTDGWISRVVEGAETPHHPLGVPPHFITNGGELGLDLEARPTIDEVLACRADRLGHVRDVIAHTTPAELARASSAGFTVLGAIQVVIFEEWAHHQYATRDLARLESASGSGST